MNAINWWTWDAHAAPLGWFAVDFLLFVGGLVAFCRKPLRSAFRQRHRGIKQAVSEAASGHARAMREHHLWRDKLAGVAAEVEALLQSSAADGERERQAQLAQAKAQIELLRRDTTQQNRQLQQQARERLRQSLLEQILRQVGASLQQTLTPDDQARLLMRATAALQQAPLQSPRSRAQGDT